MCIRDSYKAAVQIVGGEQYILSAVMHADEINHAMTEALGREVYHYHLHVVYVPVVEKQILWSKRCKDKACLLYTSTHDFCHKYHILDKTDSGLQEQVVYFQHVAFVLSFEFSTLAEVRLK